MSAPYYGEHPHISGTNDPLTYLLAKINANEFGDRTAVEHTALVIEALNLVKDAEVGTIVTYELEFDQATIRMLFTARRISGGFAGPGEEWDCTLPRVERDEDGYVSRLSLSSGWLSTDHLVQHLWTARNIWVAAPDGITEVNR